MGMGRTSVASSRGLDAVGINPANLALPDEGTVTISLAPLGIHIGSDFLTYGLYSDYFTGIDSDSGRIGRTLTDQDKRAILDAFPGSLGRLAADAEVRPIGLSLQIEDLGIFALTMTEHLSGYARIPNEYLRFLFYGNPPGSRYDFGESSARGWWTREYELSFGTELPTFGFLKSFAAGAGVKIIHGFGYYELERFNTSLATAQNGVLDGTLDVLARGSSIDLFNNYSSSGFTPFPAPAGTGVGFDLGVTGELTDYIRVGLSVTDIGSIEWTRNVKEAYARGNVHLDDPLSSAQRDSLEDLVKGDTREGSAFSTPLPTTLRMGAAVELHKMKFFKPFMFGELLVECDYSQGFYDIGSTTKVGRLSLGLEYKPWNFLPIRTGVSFGGADHFSYALGLGFHFGVFDLDLASENIGWIFAPRSLSYASAALGMRFRI
jgi:hypothetical protein